MATDLLLALDQGTTSTRAIVFDADGGIRAAAQRPLTQIYPGHGLVEHDPEEIWAHAVAVCREAMTRAGADPSSIAALGITNQRETTVIWDRQSGRPIHNAIVWQDRRTAETCRALVEAGHEAQIQARTGLVIDPYFSATKIAWILDHVPDARAAAERGDLAFGTIDSFLLWRLTGGRVHATDATNASRTLLMNLASLSWDRGLCELFGVPLALLPEIRDTAGDFGASVPDLLGGAIRIAALAGDQQAALAGQACFAPGMVKSTYGTGCFVLARCGDVPPTSSNRLLATLACCLDGKASYGIEGSIFTAGAAVQWLRDGLGVIEEARETQRLAESVADNGGVYFVPALTGLGAPHWDPDARGLITGLDRASTKAHLARAALEAVVYQTGDLIEAMARDGAAPSALRVDGGMVGNDWMLQFLADYLAMPVERAAVAETTSLGAAWLAGLAIGLYRAPEDLARAWRADRRFEPAMDAAKRAELRAGWHDAVARARSKAG